MQKKKGIALVLSFALVACLAVAGTLAWLTAYTKTVTNEFVIGKIAINLDESKATYDEATGTWVLNDQERVEGNKYKNVYPGAVIDKDPFVTVEKGSEACWLFVTVSPDPDNDDDLLDYDIAQGWTKLNAGVYYREVSLADANAGVGYQVFVDDEVTVSADANGTSTFENIVLNAYAIQSEGIAEPADAWAEVNQAANNA